MQKERIEFIDFAKGFAILTIIFMHVLMTFPLSEFGKQLIACGGAGVHLFIFLSGFGLALSGYRDMSEFVKHRLTKVLLPYYACITFIFIFDQFVPIYKAGFYAYLGHIFLFKMFDERIVGSFGYHFWFISTIIQLYLLYPALDTVKKRFGAKILLVGGTVVSFFWWLFIDLNNLYQFRVWNSFCFQYLWEFCLGIYLADLYLKKNYKFWEQKNTILVAVWAGTLLIYGVMAYLMGNVVKIFNDIPIFFAYTSLTLMVFLSLDDRSWLRGAISKVGLISYQLYLIHYFLIALVMRYV